MISIDALKKIVQEIPPMPDLVLRLLDMCPRTDGACAVIYASEEYAEKICPQPAWLVAATNTTRA